MNYEDHFGWYWPCYDRLPLWLYVTGPESDFYITKTPNLNNTAKLDAQFKMFQCALLMAWEVYKQWGFVVSKPYIYPSYSLALVKSASECSKMNLGMVTVFKSCLRKARTIFIPKDNIFIQLANGGTSCMFLLQHKIGNRTEHWNGNGTLTLSSILLLSL